MMSTRFKAHGILWAVLGLLLLAPATLLAESYQDTPAYDLISRYVDQIVMNDLTQRFGADYAQSCIETRDVALCLAPGMPQDEIDELLRKLPIYDNGDRYSWGGRWVTTATDGPTGGWGNPITLTYSFLPDGTYIPPGAGEPGSPSSIYAEMNSHFGSEAVWKGMFAEVFALWGVHIGITYIEVSDDGAAFPSAVGILGYRGDVRLGAHHIDGYYGILGYNYYPSVGDMVLDTGENWGVPANDYVFFRNVTAHEHGHGHGLAHSTPNNCTKLMESSLCTNFTGPQDDDIRGGMRNYGDVLENDDDAATANQLGAFTGDLDFALISLNDRNDEDWFEFDVTAGSLLDVMVEPYGFAYQEGGEVLFTYRIQDLSFEIRDGANGENVLINVDDTIEGFDEVLTDYALAPGTYWLRVKSPADATHDVQRYNLYLNLTIDDLTAVAEAVPAHGMGLQVYPNPFNPKTTARFYVDQAGDVSLNIYNVAGGLVTTIDRTADAAGWLSVEWNGTNSRGQSVPTGVYFMRAQTGARSETVRAVLLK